MESRGRRWAKNRRGQRIKSRKCMKSFKASSVTATQAGDYFQVNFDETPDSLKNYLLIQRGFEFEDLTPDPVYVECDDLDLCGHVGIREVIFTRERFYLQADEAHKDFAFEITYQIDENNYRKVKRILDIIFSDCRCFDTE